MSMPRIQHSHRAGLWRKHRATPQQRPLFSARTRKQNAKPTQADLLIAMLRESHASGKPLVPAIMRAGIAQHGARFKELRDQGFEIENEMERASDGVHSRYWLRHDPEQGGAR